MINYVSTVFSLHKSKLYAKNTYFSRFSESKADPIPHFLFECSAQLCTFVTLFIISIMSHALDTSLSFESFDGPEDIIPKIFHSLT